MTDRLSRPTTAFHGADILCSGTRLEVALALKRRDPQQNPDAVLVFDDVDGRVVDLDLRGSEAEIAARLGGTNIASVEPEAPMAAPRSRGRPKLGVVSREITLLPRHWEWLSRQRGGASAALRRLVDEARKGEGDRGHRKAAQEAAYNFLQAIAGDFAGYEDAMRALFKADRDGFDAATSDWPAAIRGHAIRLAFGPPEGHAPNA